MNATQTDEITAYVEGVRRALASIDPGIRQELLEDLPEHLAEVRAEGTGTLVERLGTPEAYASELRATAGLVGGFPDPPPDRMAALLEARDNVLEVLNRADVRVGPLIGYAKVSDFLVLLRPAWWVARGYLLAMAIAYVLKGSRDNVGLMPRIGGNDLLAIVLLAGCVVVSIVLGRRTLSFWPRYALWSGTAMLVLFAIAGFNAADSETRYPTYNDVSSYGGGNPYANISDVFVYDGQGRLVVGARLYDQDGQPIQLGNNYCTDPNTGESSRSRSLGYPFCPQNAPLGAAPSAAPRESASAPALGGPSPVPSATSARPESTFSEPAAPTTSPSR